MHFLCRLAINDRLHLPFNNWYRGQHFGNANLWDGAARTLGIPVNGGHDDKRRDVPIHSHGWQV